MGVIKDNKLTYKPKKENEINSVLKNLKNLDYSIVFFAPGQKLNYYIKFFKKYFFDRKIENEIKLSSYLKKIKDVIRFNIRGK